MTYLGQGHRGSGSEFTQDELKVLQQVNGGENIRVFKGLLTPGGRCSFIVYGPSTKSWSSIEGFAHFQQGDICSLVSAIIFFFFGGGWGVVVSSIILTLYPPFSNNINLTISLFLSLFWSNGFHAWVPWANQFQLLFPSNSSQPYILQLLSLTRPSVGADFSITFPAILHLTPS